MATQLLDSFSATLTDGPKTVTISFDGLPAAAKALQGKEYTGLRVLN